MAQPAPEKHVSTMSTMLDFAYPSDRIGIVAKMAVS